MRVIWAGWVVLAALLSGCASGPSSTAGRLPSGIDGPPASPPPNLSAVPNAEPRIEPIRSGGPNKPYVVLGHSYEPQTADVPWHERGLASWYGRKFHGHRTASGEIYSMYGMTAAHRTLPIPSYARVRNLSNGREVIVRVNDRGPFHSDRIIDLSYAAALKLGILGAGTTEVEVERLTFQDIRTGAWRHEGAPAVAATEPQPMPELAKPGGSEAAAALTPDLRPAAPVGVPTSPETSADARATPVATADAASATSPAVPAEAQPAVSHTDASPTHDLPPEQRARAYTAAARGFWVQLGAFKRREGAESFQRRVAKEFDALSPLLAIFNEASIFRLQAGPYSTRAEAREVAHRVRDTLSLVPVIVERR